VRKHKVVLAGVTLLAASLAMSACGTRAEQAPGGEAGAEKVAKIGVIAPLSGPLSALGAGIKNSVDLAIKQANEKQTIPGWTLEIDAQDERASPTPARTLPLSWPVMMR
jgi:branched-chain amino acid transport system substrate-binding protein